MTPEQERQWWNTPTWIRDRVERAERHGSAASQDAVFFRKRMVRLEEALRAMLPGVLGSELEYQTNATYHACVHIARAALSEQPDRQLCEHEWVDARNKVVESGEVCVKCHAIRAAHEDGPSTCSYCAGKGGRYRTVASRFIGTETMAHQGPWETCSFCGGTGKPAPEWGPDHPSYDEMGQ